MPPEGGSATKGSSDTFRVMMLTVIVVALMAGTLLCWESPCSAGYDQSAAI
jgi:hypothetical protein